MAIVAGIALLAAGRATAEPVDVIVYGTIEHVEIVPAAYAEALVAGVPFWGVYVVDPERPARAVSPGLGFYWAESLYLEVGGEVIDVPVSANPALGSGVQDVRDDYDLGDGSFDDRISTRFGDGSGTFGMAHTQVSFDLEDPTATALSSADLVVAPEVEDFETRFELRGQVSVPLECPCPIDLRVEGRIERIYEAPEPAMGLLLPIGAGAIAVYSDARRRRSRAAAAPRSPTASGPSVLRTRPTRPVPFSARSRAPVTGRPRTSRDIHSRRSR